MAEHITRNDGVVGSIPTASSSTEIPSTARFPVKLGTVLWREFLPFTLRAGERPLSGGAAKLTARPFSMVNDRLINARSFNGPPKPYKKTAPRFGTTPKRGSPGLRLGDRPPYTDHCHSI